MSCITNYDSVFKLGHCLLLQRNADKTINYIATLAANDSHFFVLI